MKLRPFAAFALFATLAGCAGKPPYEIVERQEKTHGVIVSYRVAVPDRHTRDNLQSWCNEITQREAEGTIVDIEFVYANRQARQLGFCLSGELHTIADLDRMPAVPGAP